MVGATSRGVDMHGGSYIKRSGHGGATSGDMGCGLMGPRLALDLLAPIAILSQPHDGLGGKQQHYLSLQHQQQPHQTLHP